MTTGRILTMTLVVLLPVTGCRSEREKIAARAPTSATFRAAVNAVLPAVVYIEVEGHADSTIAVSTGASAGVSGKLNAAPPQEGSGPPPGGVPTRGAGSGVIFRPDGYVLTSDHVVRGADQLRVTLHDHREFPGRIVARDPSTDVAVVKIDATGLPTAALGNSDQLDPGDWVLALGSPLGLQFSVTAGVVSATGRSIGILADHPDPQSRAAPLEHFIQTDAAINPGNSGGPLVDLGGRVIGINTAIATPTGVFAGAGFAVPINLARHTAEQLIRYHEVRRATLGVLLDDVDGADAKVYRLPVADGAEVVHVDAGGPAARAGLAMGDVVVAIDSVQVKSVGDLQAALAGLEPGKTTQLQVLRYGRRMVVPVELGTVRSGIAPPPPRPVSDATGLGFGVVDRGGRLVVDAVLPYSPAERARLRQGQVIEAVNRRPVHSVDGLRDALERSREAVSLEVLDPSVGRMIVNFTPGP